MIKEGSMVYSKQMNMFGQVVRIRNNIATITFVTGVKVKKNIDVIEYENGHWRIDD